MLPTFSLIYNDTCRFKKQPTTQKIRTNALGMSIIADHEHVVVWMNGSQEGIQAVVDITEDEAMVEAIPLIAEVTQVDA